MARPGRPRNYRALSKPKHISKQDHKHYWPYIPVLLLILATVFVSVLPAAQHRGVLSYATQISQDGLLTETNNRRAENGRHSLESNTTLEAAAQAKANDMVKRNYWSHNTPDGKAPWVFITNEGYLFQKAGENLAYGFTTDGATVSGWMNSQEHRENMLNPGYTQVGFGTANSSDFNHDGETTVVVALYARPQALAQATTVAATPNSATFSGEVPEMTEPHVLAVSRIQTLTGGRAPWAYFAIGALLGLLLAAILLKQAAGIRHMLKDGERFVLHHPILDTFLATLVFVSTLLAQTTGFIH
ncbi:MAG: CAP domain-containing protein [Candidatus Saccharimonadales bacterium]